MHIKYLSKTELVKGRIISSLLYAVNKFGYSMSHTSRCTVGPAINRKKCFKWDFFISFPNTQSTVQCICLVAFISFLVLDG